MTLQYFTSADSPNIEARFAPYVHHRTQKQPDGTLKKNRFEEIACYVRVKGDRRGEDMQLVKRHNEDELKRNYARAWAAFQGEKVNDEIGTPIEELFPEDPQLCEYFRELGIRTVEYFAQAPENIAQRVGMGWRKKQEEAKDLIRKRMDVKFGHVANQPEFNTASEKAMYEQALAKLNEQFKEFQKGGGIELKPESESKPVKRGPGRPPKVKEAAHA